MLEFSCLLLWFTWHNQNQDSNEWKARAQLLASGLDPRTCYMCSCLWRNSVVACDVSFWWLWWLASVLLYQWLIIAKTLLPLLRTQDQCGHHNMAQWWALKA